MKKRIDDVNVMTDSRKCSRNLVLVVFSIPISRYPTIEILSLSQVVEPNQADRFTITLGNDMANRP
jgi:hypothetical protein